jgi:hypothetical protein
MFPGGRKMIDEVLVQDLIAAPVQNWPLLIERASVLRDLSNYPRLNRCQVHTAAAALNVGPRRIYSLIKAYRQRLKGAPARGPQTGKHFHIDCAKEQVIAEAIKRAGPSARFRDVWRYVQEVSRERDIDLPSESAVKTRFGKAPVAIDLAGRLNTCCDYIADLCTLELNLKSPAGAAGTAHLLAVVETSSAAVVHYEVFRGAPAKVQIASSLATFVTSSSVPNTRPSIGLTWDGADESLVEHVRAKGWAIDHASASRKLTAGYAITAVFGLRLGRIPLRTARSRTDIRTEFPTAPADIAAVVLKRVLEQRGAS